MEELNKLVPTTVLVAILLFFLKELVENSKKRRAKKRKTNAFKAILAEEIERNFWVWQSLRRILVRIQGDLTGELKMQYKVRTDPAGTTTFCTFYEDGSWSGSRALPHTSMDYFTRHAVEIAELNETLYLLARACYDEIAEIAHVRTSLINEINEEEQWSLPGFVDYGIDTLDRGLPAIQKLYQFCTGAELKNPKLR